MNALELKLPPVLVAFLAGAGIWVASMLAPAFALPIPWRSTLAGASAAAGMALALAGVLEFRKARTTVDPTAPSAASAFVAAGVYRFSRNPMYLGMLLVLLGWAAYTGNALSLALLAGFVGYMNRFQIAPEERALRLRFGAPYVAYLSCVRRWV